MDRYPLSAAQGQSPAVIDHSKDKRPGIKASLGSYGSALVITIYPDGEVVGCDVAHEAHQKKPFSSAGSVKIAVSKSKTARFGERVRLAARKKHSAKPGK
jgi:hypothetical protein